MMFRCPKCRSAGTFRIEAQIDGPNLNVIVNTDGDVIEKDDNDIIWENHSSITCLDCQYESEVCSFYPQERVVNNLKTDLDDVSVLLDRTRENYEELRCAAQRVVANWETICNSPKMVIFDRLFASMSFIGDLAGSVRELARLLAEGMEVGNCKFCGFPVDASEAHGHQDRYVCGRCWDDRLKNTE